MPISTTTALITSLSPANFEDNLLFTATVTGSSSNVPGPGVPGGNVQFWDGPIGTGLLLASVPLTNLTGSTGQAQMQISSLTAGSHSINAFWSGDANFSSSPSNTVSQQINSVVGSGNVLPGFALIAEFSPLGDGALPPQALLYAVPANTHVHVPVDLLWDTLNVAFVRITGNNGVDYMTPPPPGSLLGFDTTLLSTSGAGIYVVSNGFTATITLTLQAYDATQTIILGLTSSVTITIT